MVLKRKTKNKISSRSLNVQAQKLILPMKTSLSILDKSQSSSTNLPAVVDTPISNPKLQLFKAAHKTNIYVDRVMGISVVLPSSPWNSPSRVDWFNVVSPWKFVVIVVKSLITFVSIDWFRNIQLDQKCGHIRCFISVRTSHNQCLFESFLHSMTVNT